MPELGTKDLGTTELGTPSSQTTRTLTATGALTTASGAGATLTTTGTLTATGAIASTSPSGAVLNIVDETTSELGAGTLGTGELGVAPNPNTVTLTAQSTTADARGATTDLLTSTTLLATGATARVSTPGATLNTISGGILGTGELGGGELGVETGTSGVFMSADGTTADASGGGNAKLISLDLPEVATGSRGWHVEIDHPSGRTLSPELLDDPQFTPVLNGRPRVTIPVPRDEKWLSEAFDEARLSVWKDGRILPIDELISVRMEPGRTVLVGRGGRALAGRVQAEYDNKQAHEAVRELGEANTPYVMNVDDPATSLQSDQLMQSGDDSSELRGVLVEPIAPTDPVEIVDGQLQLQQSAVVKEGESVAGFSVSGGEYSGGAAVQHELLPNTYTWDISFLYDVEAEHVGIAVRNKIEDGSDIEGVNWYFNGEQLDSVTGGFLPIEWSDFSDGPRFQGSGYNGYTGETLEAGETYELELEVVDDGSPGGYHVDLVSVYDTRFNYTWDNDNGGNGGYLDGPELKPDAFEVVFDDVASAFNVDTGQIDIGIDDTSGGQALALSNDRGGSYTTASNTDTLDVDFQDAGSTLRWKVTLSRYGSRTGETPKQGFNSQSLDSFELRADLEDTPVLTQQTYDGALVDVLNQIADYGDFIWEFRRESRDEWSLEWTKPGQRTADIDDDIADYQVEKTTERRYDRAIIKGANQPVRGERFTAVEGSWVDLNQSSLVSATETVRDPSSGETFELNRDFDLDRQEGRIRVRPGGAMADGSVYEIDYEFKTRGSYTAEDADDDPDEMVRTISSITSNRGCEQAALYLIRNIKDPLWEAEVTVSTADAGRSLVDDLALEGLPTRGERMEIQEIQQTPQEVVLRLGSRQSVGEVVNDIQSWISTVSERV
ncbi:hypothetical protein [Halorussus marinus]|uniref:hypothetical protein n=1 Tax=Halorussus marinus TaxID=2505976 RepID=UPI001092BBBD|nr:hypothetical protein [Halorussus marinus]